MTRAPDRWPTFSVPFEHFRLAGDLCGDPPPQALVLHGGGPASGRALFQNLRRALWERGVGTAAFDCVGHGETGGRLEGSSLESRTRQALTVLGRLTGPPRGLMGVSMGGYTAVKLLASAGIDRLVLIVPAVYAREAYGQPFGAPFSRVIRRPRSWAGSDAWDLLGGFTGRLLVVAGENDAVIPPEVTARIYASASRSRERRLMVIPGAGHMVLTDLAATDPMAYQRVLDAMAETLTA
jgi:pimeloyl-ACP methyl ester carboxylesterase